MTTVIKTQAELKTMQNPAMALKFYRALYTNELGVLEPTEMRLKRKGRNAPEIRSFVTEPDRIKLDIAELMGMNRDGFEVFGVVNRIRRETLDAISEGKPTGKNAKGEPRYTTGDANIEAIRAFFADVDRRGTTPTANFEKLENAPIRPTIIVNTSADKFQAYWRVADAKVEDFRRVQRVLAKRYGGDKSVCNPARIMRFPGFLHLKYEPTLSVLVGGF